MMKIQTHLFIGLVTMFTLQGCWLPVAEENLPADCSYIEEKNYTNPYYRVSYVGSNNYRVGDDQLSFIRGQYDTVAPDRLIISLYFENDIYAYPLGAWDTSEFIQPECSYKINQEIRFVDSIEGLAITTNHPLGNNIQKNDTINHLFDIQNCRSCTNPADKIPLTEYLKKDSIPIILLARDLSLKNIPAEADTFSIDIHVTLTNGQRFGRATNPVVFNQ